MDITVRPSEEVNDEMPVVLENTGNPFAQETVTVKPKIVKETIPVDAPFHIHHAIIGAGIAGASLLALFIPQLKENTRYIIAGLGVSLGVALVYDDLTQHIENGCDFSSILNFTPCPEE